VPTGIPLSSPTEEGYAPANAFDGTGYTWLAKGNGPAVDGAYIGLDYGAKPLAATSVRIVWVAAHWLPDRLRVEYSDDGLTWSPVVTRRETAPADQNGSPGLKRWEETIRLPRSEPHRMWRVVADGVPTGHFFGVDELALLP
jgi:hypothetical protein